MLKLQCFYDFKVYNENWHEELSINELADMITDVLSSSSGHMNMLSEEDKLLICIEGLSLNLSVYNASEEIVTLLAEMATAEGLYIRKSEK